MKRIFALLSLSMLAVGSNLFAQCIQFNDCPAALQYCDQSSNNAAFWNASYWYSSLYQSHDLAEGSVDLSVSASDPCNSGAIGFRYLLMLDLDNDGVLETVIDSKKPQQAGFVPYNNINNPDFSGGIKRRFDQRSVPLQLLYKFGLQVKNNNGVYTARVVWNSLTTFGGGVQPQLPLGNHKIKWFASNQLGDESVCSYLINIQDCKKPAVHCYDVSVNLPSTKLVNVYATDPLLYSTDNISSDAQIVFGIRKAGTGTGFPTSGNGQPQSMVTFGCNELGVQPVEIWARDLAGNADFCTTTVIVQDNGNYCTGSGLQIPLCAKSVCNQTGIEDVTFNAQGSGSGIPPFSFFALSNSQGCIGNSLPIPVASNAYFSAFKDDNPLNGFNNADLVLIQQHINGTQPFNSPWQWVAADANRDNVVDSLDLIELTKLMLGIYTELPNNTSWRFVRDDYVFPAGNPLSAPIPETFNISEINASTANRYLLGIKIGDVNCTAMANTARAGSDERDLTANTKAQPAVLPAQPNPGSGDATITVIAVEKSDAMLHVFDLSGRLMFQTTLSMPEAGVYFLRIPAEALPVGGIYPYRVQAGDFVFTGKLLHQD